LFEKATVSSLVERRMSRNGITMKGNSSHNLPYNLGKSGVISKYLEGSFKRVSHPFTSLKVQKA
jgi:hypothetical protein